MFIHQQESVFIFQEQSKHNPRITGISKNDSSNNNEQGSHSPFCKADKTLLTFGREEYIFLRWCNERTTSESFSSVFIAASDNYKIKHTLTSERATLDFFLGCKELSNHISVFQKYLNLNSTSGILQLSFFFFSLCKTREEISGGKVEKVTTNFLKSFSLGSLLLTIP